MSSGEARVVVLGKPDCHLCDIAKDVVARVCAELDVAWVERSIVGNAELQRRYAELIPVVLVDGRQIAVWRVDEQRLRVAIAR
ncbi:MAG: glutaredoxin family protein [Jiangellaceae bacterium]|nr:glutaredoxin family protein [Jiangellaceae bacterium]